MGARTPGNEDWLAAPDDTVLAVEQRRARRRAVRNIASLRLDNIAKVLTHERYWTRDFVQVFLDRCDLWILDDPHRAATFAAYGPRLAERIRVGEQVDDVPSAAEHASRVLRARGIVADTLRTVGNLDGAREILAGAYRFCARQSVSRDALAELHRRRALLVAADDLEQAKLYLGAAIDLAREIGDHPPRGEIHLARAWLLMNRGSSSGLEELALAVSSSNPRRPRSSTVFAVALDRLWRLVTRVPSLAVDEEPRALRAVHRAQRRLYGHSNKSVGKTMLYWTEALLTRRLGIERHTERRLLLARDNFLVLGATVQAFLVHFDLADFYGRQGLWEKARETLAAAGRLTADLEPLAATLLTRGRAVLEQTQSFRVLRHDACALLPMPSAPAALLPTPPADAREGTILARG
ncbi:MAG: hypothetical protein AAGE94_07655 [Acidobacteriota bacterium]